MPSRLPDVIPVSDLEHDASSVLRRVRDSQATTVITQEGRATAVLISIESYRRTEAEREILARLARGEQEIASGEGFDLEDVLAEADSLLDRRGA
jgi:prevent-host-death family protein